MADQSYDPQMLEWIAAINGQTPGQYVSTQANINNGYNPNAAQNTWINNGLSGQGLNDALWQQQQQQQQTQQLWNAQVDAANTGLGVAYEGYDPIVNQSRDRANYIQGINGGLANQIATQAQTSNDMRTGALGNYGTAVGNAGAWDLGNYNNLVSAANAPMQMTASPYVGDAQSDPADVARQLASYNQLQGIANGSLDQTSQAAQAYANARDVANQDRAAQTLEDAGNGALNVNFGSIQGIGDLYGVYQGTQDVHVGQEDPAAYAAAVDARNQLGALTNPQVTAQERLMYELSRQQQENDESATRQALETEAARRGMAGTGTNVARSALAAQQTSRNRMLQDMQANAQAQARAMDALQGYGTLSTNMTAQANQVAEQNQAVRTNALTNYTGIAANNATANANRQLAAQEAAYNAYATLRAQGFSEEYARGVAYDNMANANANRQLAGAQSAGQMSTDMRNASDAMSRFNQSQRQQQSQFSDTFTANRQDAQFGRATTVFNAGNTVGRNYMTDQGNLFNATTGVADSNFNTTNSAIGTQAGLNGQWLGAQNQADQNALGALTAKQNIIQTQLGNNTARAQNNTTFGNQAVQRQIQLRGIGQQNQANQQWDAASNGGSNVVGNYGVGAQGAYTPINYTQQPMSIPVNGYYYPGGG